MSHRESEVISDCYKGLDRWETRRIVEALLASQINATSSISPLVPLIEQAADNAAHILARGNGRLIYCGAGASGRLAVQDGVELFPTYGWPHERLIYLMAGGTDALIHSLEGAEDDGTDAQERLIAHNIAPGDVLIAVAASGGTPFAVSAAQCAQNAGALVIALANNRDTLLGQNSDFALECETGPEVIAGSTRMAAGTAQKAILNILSTTIMVRLNRVYDNVMVDLSSKNAKLNERRFAILKHIIPAEENELRNALNKSDNNIKLAALLLYGDTETKAMKRLDRFDGDLRAALEDLNT